MVTITKNQTTALNYKDLVLTTVKEKYPYFLLGATVILIVLLLVTTYFGKNVLVKINLNKPTANQQNIPKKQALARTYVVSQGDSLWKIAEQSYGSGYNAYDIAIANKLTDANVIEAGQILVIPSVTAKQPTQGEIAMAKTAPITIKENTYTVKEGDDLWDIALGAYGDGYMWVSVAKANNLTNPDLIHAGNVLKLPR